MNDSLVSIIIAVYNAEKYIDNTIEAIRNQTYSNIQIVLVDDGSSDNSLEKCIAYSRIDERIIVIHQNNMGPGCARNVGIKASNGDYLVFVDADDYIDICFIEHLVLAITEKDYDVAIAGYKKRYSNGIVESFVPKELDSNNTKLSDCLEYFAKNSLIQGPCWKIFKKEIVLQNGIHFHENWKYGEDSYFVYNYLCFVLSWRTVPFAEYYYEIRNNGSLSSSFTKEKISNSIELFQLLKKICDYTDDSWMGELMCGCFITYCDDLIKTNIKYIGKIHNIKWAISELNSSKILTYYNEKHRIRILYRFCVIHNMYCSAYLLSFIRNVLKKRLDNIK